MTILIPFILALTQGAGPVRSASLPPLTEKQLKWWRDAKFGMFIHWGLYAIPAKGEWYMNNEHVPVDQYRKLSDNFHPQSYDPNQWVRIARSAGMNYMVLTARHHDGFALWDSADSVYGFTSMNSAAKRDLVREYVNACRRAKMRVGLYYSLMDWRLPGYYKPHELPDSAEELKRQCYGQVTELTHNYGPIDVLWYDGGWLNMQGSDADAAWLWEPVKLNQIVRKANPMTVINPRSGWEGDFDCEEGNQPVKGPVRPRAWEKCLNLNKVTWGFNRQQNLMSFEEIVTTLVDTAARDGNVLLNVGPDADGVIPPAHVDRLRQIGSWLRKYGESIYGTRGGPWQPVDGEYGATCRGKTIYVHAYHCTNGTTLGLPPIDVPLKKVSVLTGGRALLRQTRYTTTITLSNLTTVGPDTIIRIN